MKFLVDNSLSPALAVGLRSLGFDARHLRDALPTNSPDEVVFDLAATEDRALIAADTDFAAILAHRSANRPSLLLFRTSRKSTGFLLSLFKRNSDTLCLELSEGSIVVVEDDRIRVRRLPVR